MSKISDRVETLARAMCAAVDVNPDEALWLGAGYDPYPRITRPGVVSSTMSSTESPPNWMRFAWRAHLWIFEHSGGELPAANETTPA